MGDEQRTRNPEQLRKSLSHRHGRDFLVEEARHRAVIPRPFAIDRLGETRSELTEALPHLLLSCVDELADLDHPPRR
jgi:hypothetical protein